jgi:hypothetical protein
MKCESDSSPSSNLIILHHRLGESLAAGAVPLPAFYFDVCAQRARFQGSLPSERVIRPVAFVRFAGYFETLGSNRRRVIYTKREVTNGYFWYTVEPPVTVRTISISLIFSWFTV